MKTKICFKCGAEKSLNEFYEHPKMRDGHLNKCIDCTKKDTRNRIKNLQESDSDWVSKERKRGREKYHRLNYKNKKSNYEIKRKQILKYAEQFPEKILAKNHSQHINVPDGKQKHHWSYNQEHYKDVLFFSVPEHYKIHRYIIYDQERMMYRTIEGVLLDTKERHLEYFNKIKDLEE